MSLDGWSSFSMVLKYAHLSRKQLHDAAQNIDVPSSSQHDYSSMNVKLAPLEA